MRMSSNNYRAMAAPMCGNCKSFKRRIVPIQGIFVEEEETQCLQHSVIHPSSSGVCDVHEYVENTLEVFKRVYKGALPVTIMIPSPSEKMGCKVTCVLYVLEGRGTAVGRSWEGSCKGGFSKNGKPSKGCPHYKGGEE